MNKLIPAPIQNDMKALATLVQTTPRSVTNEHGYVASLEGFGDQESGGLFLAFKSPHSLTLSTDVFDYGGFIKATDSLLTHADHLFGRTYRLTTEVTLEGLEPAEFTCIHDFNTAEGLPACMYQAYAHIHAGLDIPLERRLELFGAITFALPLHHWKIFLGGDFSTMAGHLNVSKGLLHDLNSQQLTTA